MNNTAEKAEKVPFFKDKNRLVTTGVVLLLCGIFVFGFIYGLNRVMAMEGTMVPVVDPEPVTVPEEVEANPIAFIENAVSMAKTSGEPTLNVSDSFGINENEDEGRVLKIEGNASIGTVADYIRDNFEDALSDYTEDVNVEYGKDINSALRAPVITPDMVCEKDGFSNSYIYYSCYSCGEQSDEPLDHCEACGSERPYDLRWNNYYTLTWNLDPDKALAANYDIRTPEKAIAMLGDSLDGVCTVDNLEISYDSLSMVATVERATNHLGRIEYFKNVTAVAKVTFVGDYADLGEATITCPICESVRYSLTWPSLALSAHEMVIEPGDTNNLLASLTCDNPIDYTDKVVWSSSDESIVTVDEEGYMDTCKNKENKPLEATVTASFEYNGKTYSDSCLIKVITPVESSKMNKKKLTLNPGESFKLEAKLSPAKATVKDIKWESLDEGVATVDENGNVTAVASGTATVRSISVDGYYISTCEVTVK